MRRNTPVYAKLIPMELQDQSQRKGKNEEETTKLLRVGNR
jgi:hypothetical protein